MDDHDTLLNVLTECIDAEKVTAVIETGTYLGLGSTRTIAEAFLKTSLPNEFITIEANWSSWRKARQNLSQYNFVKALWGKSVAQQDAIRFISNDLVLKQHEKYPDIWIDDISDPGRFYIEEIMGKLGDDGHRDFDLVRTCLKPFIYRGEDLLKKYLGRFRELKPLIVLDSAGGIGYLEFTIVLEIMSHHNYLILLDDIHHLKHFRSFQKISSDKKFTIIALNEEDGWVLAKHHVEQGSPQKG